MTDAKQTENGRRFWGDRIAQALERGLYVYRVNLAQKKRDQITTIREYEQWCDQMFGPEIGREEERLAITDQPTD